MAGKEPDWDPQFVVGAGFKPARCTAKSRGRVTDPPLQQTTKHDADGLSWQGWFATRRSAGRRDGLLDGAMNVGGTET